MEYRLAEKSGDKVAVPQVVFDQLARTDGDTVRVALYLLAGNPCDAAEIARALRLRSTRSAESALQFWAGAGLLERCAAEPAPIRQEMRPGAVNLAALRDPMVSTLCAETQMLMGKTLGHSELQRLVALYTEEQYPVDVILLCCTHLTKQAAQQGKRVGIGRLVSELSRWRENGVETGEDAERYLKREEQRRANEAEAAGLFGMKPEELTQVQRQTIRQWYEDWKFDAPMIGEAILHAEGKGTIRYVGGILRAWHAQGYTRPADVRGNGALAGSNITATSTAAKPGSEAIEQVFQQDWNAVFDD